MVNLERIAGLTGFGGRRDVVQESMTIWTWRPDILLVISSSLEVWLVPEWYQMAN